MTSAQAVSAAAETTLASSVAEKQWKPHGTTSTWNVGGSANRGRGYWRTIRIGSAVTA